MPDPRILGLDGRPIRRKDLARPVAAASLTGVRQAWNVDDIAGSITPESLAATLGGCDRGEARAYLTLAEQMEEKEPHYRSVLTTRKRAVCRLPATVEAASESADDRTLTEEISALTRASGFRGLLFDALDGLGKGFAAVAINWDTRKTPWLPRNRWSKEGRIPAYEWKDPRWFRYDRETGRRLRLLDEADPVDGIPLPPNRFIVHEPKLKSGLPIRGGLARVAAVAYMAKAYTLKDWLAFAEVYGLPLRVGKYGNEANEEDIQTLITAVANIGTDAAAVMPESMGLEFIETSTGASGDLFERLADWSDRQVSKAVLGQVASTEGTPGKLGNDQLQGDVRDDLRDADAEELADTLNRDLVEPYTLLNHGPRDTYPTLQLRAPEPEDIQALSTALSDLVPLGLRVKAVEIRDKLGLAAPEEKDEILGRPAPDTDTATNRREPGCSCCNGHAHANNRQEPTDPDLLDELAEEGAADWEEQLAPVVDPVQALADGADGYEAFLAGLPGLLEEMDPGELMRSLAEQAYQARGAGDATDDL